MKKQTAFTRRQFLRSGSSALIIPFLPSLLPREAWGQTPPPPPKRLIAMWTGNGTCYKNWYPSTLPAEVMGTNFREMSLSAITGQISPILGPELSALRNKLLLLRGLDGMSGDGHNTEEILAAGYSPLGLGYTSQNISIDQILGASAKVYAKEPKTRVLGLAAQDRQENISYMKSGDAIVRAPFMYDMVAAFEFLFGDLGGGADEAAKIKARNLTLVDRVLEDYKRVMASKTLGTSDKQRLDSHVTFMYELEKRIKDSGAAAGCVPPAAGAVYPGKGGMNLYPALKADPYITNIFDIIVAALRCDLTRLVTLVPWHYAMDFTFIDPTVGDLHSLSHRDNALGDEPLTKVQGYFAKKYAELLKKLDDVVEDTADGSKLLDYTAVLWRQEFTGNGDKNHKKIDLPVVLGGGTKFLNSGRYVDFRTVGEKRKSYDYTWIGVPYNQVLVTLLNAFGLTPTEYEQGGKAGIGYYGELASDNRYLAYGMTDTKKRAPLPTLLK
ncbi:MAG TPA: DUF1552 domain-containing protein [Bdellovibrionales bacterium]|nr:DUF1552 domain-containing protein [Bdellovibrionales bacterium]